MADDIRTFTVTVPVGTLESAPQETPLALPLAVVERLDILIPSGHSGETGIALAMSGTQVIPHEESNWIVGNGSEISFPLEDYPESGDWSALAFNADVFEHSFHLRFLLDRREIFERRESATFMPIPL